jgi:hypothetical protein
LSFSTVFTLPRLNGTSGGFTGQNHTTDIYQREAGLLSFRSKQLQFSK